MLGLKTEQMSLEWLSSIRYRPLFGAGLLVLWLLLQIDTIHNFSTALLSHELEQQNIAYLHGAEREAQRNFTKLAEIFAVLKVIESADVGISFLIVKGQVTVGHALTALSDVVERSIDVSIAAASAAVALQVLVKLAATISPLLFKLSLLAGAIYFIVASISGKHLITMVSRVVSEVIVILFLTAYLLIPYSIHGTGWLSQHTTDELTQKSGEYLNDFHHDVVSRKRAEEREEVFRKEQSKKKDEKPRHEMVKRAIGAKHDFKRVAKDLPHKVDAMRLFLIRHTAATIIEGLIFPLGIFLVLWFALKQGVRRVGRLIKDVQIEDPGQGRDRLV